MSATVREQVLAAFYAHVQALPGVQSERNRDIPVTDFPFVVQRDGPHIVTTRNEPYADYTLSLGVEIYVASATTSGLAPAWDSIYGDLIAAIHGDQRLGGLAVDTYEESLEFPEVGRAQGQGPTYAALVTFSINFWTDAKDPRILAP